MSKERTIKIRQDKQKQALIEQLRRLPVREVAYDKVGISRMTAHRWRKASKKFASEMDAAIEEGYEFVCGMAESQLISLVRQGKFEALRFVLQHNSPRYANKLELRGSVTHRHRELTPEQRKAIATALKLTALNKQAYGFKEQKDQARKTDSKNH